MYSNSDKKLVAIYSCTHFLVDLSCIFLVTAFIIPQLPSHMDWLWCMLAYNFCAFAMQMPVGAFIDRVGKPWLWASAGCILITLSYLLTGIPILACTVSGIGNSCFHAGGGVSVLGISRRRATLSGIYVSTGAFGVYLAPKLANRFALIYGWSNLVAIGTTIICAVFLLFGHLGEKNILNNFDVHYREQVKDDSILNTAYRDSKKSLVLIAAICMFVTVCFRSYTGTIMGFSWKGVPALGLLFTVGIVMGKMFGGILGDRFGWSRVTVGSLALSALLFAMAAKLPAAGIIGVFLFNMTMPITLVALANIFEENQGFAFGLTTMALFLGTLPSMLGYKVNGAGVWWIIPAAVIFSAVVLGAGLICYNKREGDRK